MILDDCCRCGHERNMHTLANITIDSAGSPYFTDPVNVCEHATDCRCTGFFRDRFRHWLVIVRFADVVARCNGRLTVERVSPPGDGRPGGWMLKALVNSDVDIMAPSDADEAHQVVEQVVERWMQRLDVARDAASLVPTKQGDPAWRPPDHPCPTCNARTDSTCTPMHEGERDAGGWSHPARGPLTKAKSDVVRWARRVKRGELPNEIMPGIAMTGLAMQRDDTIGIARNNLVDEILALSYINECALVGVRGLSKDGVTSEFNLEQRPPPTGMPGPGQKVSR